MKCAYLSKDKQGAVIKITDSTKKIRNQNHHEAGPPTDRVESEVRSLFVGDVVEEHHRA